MKFLSNVFKVISRKGRSNSPTDQDAPLPELDRLRAINKALIVVASPVPFVQEVGLEMIKKIPQSSK